MISRAACPSLRTFVRYGSRKPFLCLLIYHNKDWMILRLFILLGHEEVVHSHSGNTYLRIFFLLLARFPLVRHCCSPSSHAMFAPTPEWSVRSVVLFPFFSCHLLRPCYAHRRSALFSLFFFFITTRLFLVTFLGLLFISPSAGILIFFRLLFIFSFAGDLIFSYEFYNL